MAEARASILAERVDALPTGLRIAPGRQPTVEAFTAAMERQRAEARATVAALVVEIDSSLANPHTHVRALVLQGRALDALEHAFATASYEPIPDDLRRRMRVQQRAHAALEEQVRHTVVLPPQEMPWCQAVVRYTRALTDARTHPADEDDVAHARAGLLARNAQEVDECLASEPPLVATARAARRLPRGLVFDDVSHAPPALARAD